MTLDAELLALVKGLRCTEVQLYAQDSWTFDFQGSFRINIQCPWRLLHDQRIALGHRDDGQKFGLPHPVNGEAAALELLSSRAIQDLTISPITGDLSLEFESGVHLEVFNSSSGYEGWNCQASSGLEVIGMGGGGYTVF